MATDPNLIASFMSRWQAPQIDVPDPLTRYAKIQALKNGIIQQQLQQQQLQSGALQLQQQQRAIADQQALDAAMTGAITRDPTTGAITYDRNKALSAVPGHMLPGVSKTFNDMDEASAKLQKAKADAITASNELAGSALLGVKDHDYDPAFFQAALTHAVGTGAMQPPAAAQLFQAAGGANATPQTVQAVTDQYLNTPGIQKILTERQTAAASETRAGAAKTEAEIATEKERVAKVTAALQAAGAASDQAGLDRARAAVIAAKGTPEEVGRIPMAFSPAAMTAFNRGMMTAEQRTQADQAEARERALEADRKVTQAQNAQRIAIENRNAGINAQKFAMEYGGDAVRGWAQQVAQNPDTANQVPPGLRTSVMQAFTAQTGLPFPKPLTGNAVEQERASRNAMDAVAQIRQAIADPAIQSRLGPILGRLGNAEQTAGTAIGLTPEQEAKAQQLRTNMRYLVFQEGKGLMGGRIPQNLMQQLEQSSPNVAMDAGTLNGALAGVTDAANRNLDQTFKQRFGENAQRQRPSAAQIPTVTTKQQYDALPSGAIYLEDGKKYRKP